MAANTSERRDLEQGRAGAGHPDNASCPMLDKEVLLDHLPALATATLLGVTAINVLTSNQSVSGDITEYKGLRQFLLAMPYTLFLFALAVLAAAIAVKRKRHMLGCVAGFLLAQLLGLVVIGGVVTLVRGEVDSRIVWPVTSGILIFVLFTWGLMCAYPKCLRWLLFCCCSKETEKALQCKTCGGITVNGRSPNPAGEGVQPCETYGGITDNGRSSNPDGGVQLA